jgi:hypothetical protein
MRSHLYACVLVPTEVRLRAKDAREAARKLIKESQQLASRGDVVMREAEAVIAALRDAIGRRTGPKLPRFLAVSPESSFGVSCSAEIAPAFRGPTMMVGRWRISPV